MTQEVVIETKNGPEIMSIDEFSRWMSLMEAFHFIEEKAIEMKKDVFHYIKPLAIEDYIKERFPSIRHDICCELEMGLL